MDEFRDFYEFEYEITSTKEKSDTIVVDTLVSNKDLSGSVKLTQMNEQDMNRYIGEKMSSGVITERDLNGLKNGSMGEIFEFFHKLFGSKKLSESVSFTVVNQDGKVLIDSIDNIDTFLAVLVLNMAHTIWR